MKRGEVFDTTFLSKDKKGVNKWARYGFTWDEKEIHYLKSLFKHNFGLPQLCMILQRPASGVVGKLRQFKLIQDSGVYHSENSSWVQYRYTCDQDLSTVIGEDDVKHIISELSQLQGSIPCTQTQVQVQYNKEGVLIGLGFDYTNSPRVVESPFAAGGFVNPKPEPFKFQESETVLRDDEWDSWHKAIVKGGAWRTINVDIPDENPTPEHILKKMKDTIDSRGPQGVALISKCSQLGLSDIHRHYFGDDFFYLKGTPMTASIKSIETKTFINGIDAADLPDGALFEMIKATEREIKDLQTIENKPEKLVKQIADKNDLLKKLVAYVDAR